MAKNLGFEPFLISDATATFERIGHDGKLYAAEEIHHMNLVSLHEEICCHHDYRSIARTGESVMKISLGAFPCWWKSIKAILLWFLYFF